MGGNVFQTAKRINKQEYDVLCKDILKKLYGISDKYAIIPSYRSKQDFGDIDIIISCNSVEDRLHLFGMIDTIFKPDAISQNSHVLSVLYQNVQVDFITIEPYFYDFCYNYFSFNDCNNFAGIIFKRIGLKFGQNGLSYVMRLNDYLIEEVVISTSFKQAIEFIGLDYDRYLLGFDDMNEVFEFISTSKYFNTELYPLEHRNNKSRVRDRKRPNYHKLLEWCKTYTGPQYEFKEPGEYLDLLFEKFPVGKTRMLLAWVEYGVKCTLKTKFNGKMVSDLTGLQGKELGQFIQYIKDEIGNGFEEWVLQSTNIDHWIKQTFEYYKNGPTE